MALNVKGRLMSNPEMIFAQMKEADICILTETWTRTDATLPSIAGYTSFHFPRVSARAHTARGGIAVYLKSHLAGLTTIWKTNPDSHYAWLRIPYALSDSANEKDLLLAACYLPPFNRRLGLSLDNAWANLEQEIAQAQALGYVLLAGDFNARTSNHSQLGTENPEDDGDDDVEDIGEKTRTSQDQVVNTMGKNMLKCCYRTGLTICNGTITPHTSGSFTCHPATGGNSVVDYYTVCDQLLPKVDEMIVERPNDPSLDHSIIRLSIQGTGTSGSTTAPAQQTSNQQHIALHRLTGVRYIIDEDKMDALHNLLDQPSTATVLEEFISTAETIAAPEDLTAMHTDLMTFITNALDQVQMPKITTNNNQSISRRRENGIFNREYRQLLNMRQRVIRSGDIHDLPSIDTRMRQIKRTEESKKKQKSQSLLLQAAKRYKAKFWSMYKNMGKMKQQHDPAVATQFYDYFKNIFAHSQDDINQLSRFSNSNFDWQPSQNLIALDNDIEHDITPEEVSLAISALCRDTTVVGTLDLKMLKAMAPSLSPALATFFNAIIKMERMPDSMAMGAISAIPKPGLDPSLPENCRPITVGTVLAKLYAACLNARLTRWAEDNGIRARGQAGFRKDHRASDNIFILDHLISRQRTRNQKLFVAFIDFKKAYDMVPREALWKKLEARGLGPTMMKAVKALYSNVPICLKINGSYTDSFQSTIGLRQGCPLSPTLFGLYLDDLEDYILSTPDAGLVNVGDATAPPLDFADDVALISTTQDGLQKQLDSLQSFSEQWEMTVNVLKTKVVVFSSVSNRVTPVENYVFTYAGNPIEVVDKFKYLGVVFHSRKTLSAAAELRVDAGYKALHGMRRRCYELGLRNTKMTCELFDYLVKPVFTFGAEIWAASILGKDATSSEKLQLRFLKCHLGVRNTTANRVVLAECGKFPMNHHYIKLVLRYWNRLIQVPEHRLLAQVFHADRQLAEEQASKNIPLTKRCWSAQVMHFFNSHLNVQPSTDRILLEDDIMEKLESKFISDLVAEQGSKTKHYVDTIRNGHIHRGNYGIQDYLVKLQKTKKRMALSQLRTSSHWLRVETGRFEDVARENRICSRCQRNEVDTEEHMIFHCTAFDHLRQEFSGLFNGQHHSVHHFLNDNDQYQVADFVEQCKSLCDA